MVRTRFAPSPTGQLHIGGLRTALMNYLFAKKYQGQFLLRIEDTDRTRYDAESEAKIHSVLEMFGLKPDAGPFKQSLRLEKYSNAAEELIDRGKAYRCFCSEERLELLRKEAAKRNEIPKYDRRCMHLKHETVTSMLRDHKPNVVRFKMDRQDIGFEDQVFGAIQQNIDESDPVLLKSDGFPTYHLANIVDDHDMEISHVIRGMEWLSSTGKHHLLYKAFEWTPPKFIHLSLIMRSATKKLSKRDKDAFVEYYTRGVLPEAVLNLLIRNGSGIKNFDPDHLYSMNEMIEDFDVDSLTRRSLLIDEHSLSRYSRKAIFQADFEKVIVPKVMKMHEATFPSTSRPEETYVRKVFDFIKEKEETFDSLELLFDGRFRWFFEKPTSSEAILKVFPDRVKLIEAMDLLSKSNDVGPRGIKKVAAETKINQKKLFQLVRIAIIGSKEGPPVSEVVDFFGPREVKSRFLNVVKLLE